MLAIHGHFTRQMRNRLKTTSIGLGLVRLLQDTKRFDEARSTLFSLESGRSDTRWRKPASAQRRAAVCSPDVGRAGGVA